MRLSDRVIEAVKQRGIKVYFADRHVTQLWNKDRTYGEPISFGGWYWYVEVKGRVIETDKDGPFRSESAAIRDAWKKLQLR